MKRMLLPMTVVLMICALCAAAAESVVVRLGNYTDIPIEKANIEITDEDIDEQIEFMLGLYATEDSSGKRTVPELTDEFVQRNLGCNTVQEYRDKLAKLLYEERFEEHKASQSERFIQQLDSISEVQLDDEEVDVGVQRYMDFFESIRAQEKLTWEQFAATYYSLDYETFQLAVREQAAYDLKGELLLAAVAEDMGLELDDDAYEQRCAVFMEQYGLSEEALNQRYSEETLRSRFMRDMLWEELL